MLRRAFIPLTIGLLGAVARAQTVGSQLPALELEGLSQTEATSVADFHGRALLIEFFAYW